VSLFACALFVVFCLFLGTESGRSVRGDSPSTSPADRAIEANSDKMIAEGRHTFRYDTFGDEAFWATRCICTRPSRGRSSEASVRA